MRALVRITALVTALAACGQETTPDVPKVDADQDGFDASEDCDDGDPAIRPTAIERCDQLDNDCDGAIDDEDDGVDPASFDTFYRDADGDGYGSADTTARACAAPEGFVDNDADCDDERALVSPEGVERCDGIDNDCDPSTPDAGVAFQDAKGAWQDLTSTFEAGTSKQPVNVELLRPGTLFLCDGVYHVSLRVGADLAIRGQNGSKATVIDAGGAAPGLWVEDPVAVEISGLTIRNAHDPFQVDGRGPALHCESAATVIASDLVLEAGPPQVYGGLVSVMDGCALELSQSVLAGGQAVHGGLMYVGGGTAVLTGVGFLEGLATQHGGALAVGTLHTTPFPTAPSTFDGDVCAFNLNVTDGSAGTGGGGAVFVGPDATVTLVNSDLARNDTADAGGAVLLDSDGLGTAVFAGTSVRFSDNTDAGGQVANDVAVPALGGRYEFTGPTTVICDEVDGCR